MSIRSLLLPSALVLAAGFAFATPCVRLRSLRRRRDDRARTGHPAGPSAGPARERAPGERGAPRVERSFSPKAACIDMVARRIGDRAYIKARLELKPEQMTAWNAFEKAADEASAKSMARCADAADRDEGAPDLSSSA